MYIKFLKHGKGDPAKAASYLVDDVGWVPMADPTVMLRTVLLNWPCAREHNQVQSVSPHFQTTSSIQATYPPTQGEP